MKLTSGRGFKGRLRTHRERRRSRLVDDTKERTSVDHARNRYGGDSGTRSGSSGLGM
jgi:hypothetical protein